MPYKTLGEALYDKGFRDTAWYPQRAFETIPTRVEKGFFDPSADDMNARYGPSPEDSESSPLRAKGNLPGAFHGREATWFVEQIAIQEFGMDPGWTLESDPWAKEDLKFVRDAGTMEFAYEWFSNRQATKAKPSPSEDTKTPLDQRVEELRSLLVPSRDLPYTAVVFLNSLWPATKVFAIAALRLYRAALRFYEGKAS